MTLTWRLVAGMRHAVACSASAAAAAADVRPYGSALAHFLSSNAVQWQEVILSRGASPLSPHMPILAKPALQKVPGVMMGPCNLRGHHLRLPSVGRRGIALMRGLCEGRRA